MLFFIILSNNVQAYPLVADAAYGWLRLSTGHACIYQRISLEKEFRLFNKYFTGLDL
jgi:hypothetical protein